jgi:hypothetical protein
VLPNGALEICVRLCHNGLFAVIATYRRVCTAQHYVVSHIKPTAGRISALRAKANSASVETICYVSVIKLVTVADTQIL